jgi:hypothetical protein
MRPQLIAARTIPETLVDAALATDWAPTDRHGPFPEIAALARRSWSKSPSLSLCSEANSSSKA